MTELFNNLHDWNDYHSSSGEFPEAFTIREEHFVLDDDLRTQINFKIDHVLDLAPSNSACVLTLTKIPEEKGFSAHLCIQTLDSTFESEITDQDANNPYEAVKAVCRDIKFQLANWKKERFDSYDPGNSYRQGA